MRIIIPMAGLGKRMRPHTLTIPKPLIPIAGKTIVERLVEDITKTTKTPIEEIAFVVGDFGKEVEDTLLATAEKVGSKGKIYHQQEALGTAHAILCAADSLKGNTIVAFADTLFKADFAINTKEDGTIWVHQVKDPSLFGVVKINDKGHITDFIEKPTKPVDTNLAIIGIYYFKDGEYLKNELQYLVDKKVLKSGEYQLTDALQNMMNKGTKFSIGKVDEWLDCGNKDATVNTNQRILEFNKDKNMISPDAKITDSVIIKPCYIGEQVEISNSIIGPHVSIEKETIINHCVITNSIIQSDAMISNANVDNSIIGNHVEYKGNILELSIGDYGTLMY